MTPATPTLVPVCRLTLTFRDRITYASTTGPRVAWSIAAGTVSGPLLQGVVADDGGELAVVRSDGTIEIDSRMMLRLADGRLIYWRAKGAITCAPDAAASFAAGGALAPSPVVFSAWFDTPPDDLVWMTRAALVGRGLFGADGGHVDLFALQPEEARHA